QSSTFDRERVRFVSSVNVLLAEIRERREDRPLDFHFRHAPRAAVRRVVGIALPPYPARGDADVVPRLRVEHEEREEIHSPLIPAPSLTRLLSPDLLRPLELLDRQDDRVMIPQRRAVRTTDAVLVERRRLILADEFAGRQKIADPRFCPAPGL